MNFKLIVLLFGILDFVVFATKSAAFEMEPVSGEVVSGEVYFVNDQFIEAAKNCDIDRVNALLELGAGVNVVDNFGITALMYASVNGHIDTVNALLSHGADINFMNARGDTALIEAAKSNHIDIVDVLLKAGADMPQDLTLYSEKVRKVLEAHDFAEKY